MKLFIQQNKSKNKMKTREEILRENYGFNKGSYNYVPAGSEILKYIGQTVVYVSYKKKSDGTWDTEYYPVLLESISDFDSLNMSYKVSVKKEKDSPSHEFRMIPEGYNWVESEDADFIERILPVSMHQSLVEDEFMYARFKELYETRDTLPVDSLYGLSTSKEKAQTIRYSRHLAVLIKLNGSDDVLYFRIQDLNLKHKSGKVYYLSVSDGDSHTYRVQIDSDQKSYPFETVGEFKIIDLIS